LYIHLCLRADRHTGRAVIELTDFARVLRKTSVLIEADLDELHRSGVCEHRGDAVEIRDRFWPYQKQTTIAAGNPQAEYLRHVREALLKPACVRSMFNGGRRKTGVESPSAWGVVGPTASGYLVGVRPEVHSHAERPITPSTFG
jgi:hypothetical protein